MTSTIRRMKVPTDGNVVVPVGDSEAGTDIDVYITPISPILTTLNEAHPTLSREQSMEKFLKLEGSIADSNFRRPD